jgi:hypothetical protein
VLSLVGAARIAVDNMTTQDFAVALFTILAIALMISMVAVTVIPGSRRPHRPR